MDTPTDQVDRAAAFAAGPGGVPRRAVLIFVVCATLLGGGGVVADHFFSGPVGSATSSTTPGTFPPPLSTSVPGPTSVQTALPSSLARMMDLQRLRPTSASPISLTDQDGGTVTLAGLRGQVVVVSFFDGSCDDICPVLEAELAQADRDLGSEASRVTLLTVNTDPLALSLASAAPAQEDGGSLPNWHFLTGSLARLDRVWVTYGISVDVQRSSGLVAHNDELDFVDSAGRLRARATPFANETAPGQYSLPASTEAAWATGIADQVRILLGPTE